MNTPIDVSIELKVPVGKLIEPTALAALGGDRILSRGAGRVWRKWANADNLMITCRRLCCKLPLDRVCLYLFALFSFCCPELSHGPTVRSARMISPFLALGCFHIAHVAVAETAYLHVLVEPLFRCLLIGGHIWLYCTVLTHVREQHLIHRTNDFDFVTVTASNSCRRSGRDIARCFHELHVFLLHLMVCSLTLGSGFSIIISSSLSISILAGG
jgi:hypothetical protein